MTSAAEFTGLDLEMALQEHYHEAVDLLDSLFLYIFKGLQSQCRAEIEVVKTQYPHADFTYPEKTLRLKHSEAIQLLKEAGWDDIQQGEDMTTPQEKALGEIILRKVSLLFTDKHQSFC